VFELVPVPAFADNYLWLLHDGANALIVDPGDAAPVQAALAQRGLQLIGTLLTHHHADHTGGVMALRAAWPQMRVWGPSYERIDGIDVRLDEGDEVELLGLLRLGIRLGMWLTFVTP
jgi:hydroxyacylglutathione hydrolase